ncbi:MAG: transglycosylase domain-containing protein, partial [Deltaproteobacteria bacterium]|nr:transglycosylase domain-containing protein [Deltaproteobacteria bacterium]MBW2534504.1 transglycosylase domain-containing protein [Deltaproteobacteria bacterium]
MSSDSPSNPPPAAAEGPADSRQTRRRRRLLWRAIRRWARRVVTALLLAVAVGSFGLWGVLSYYERDLPSVDDLKSYRPPQTTRVLARDGTLLAELFVERRTVMAIERIPQAMKLSVLAAEDADFYEHAGLDYLGMLRALYVNLRSGSARQGGSTITQQVVKNVLLTPERTFARKAREVLLARRIEQSLSKDEILELYLNHIYFGHGRYGVEEASRFYFGKGIADVSLAEAALLAGLAKAPNIYSPRVDLDRARQRRDYVLGQLALKGFASQHQVEAARGAPILLAPEVDAMPELAPEVVGEVRRTLRSLVGNRVRSGGYVVTTTIDPHLQAAARRALRRNLDRHAERLGRIGPLPPPDERKKRKSGERPKPFEGVPKAEGHHVYWAVVQGADDTRGALLVRVGQVEGTVRLSDSERYNPKGLPPSRFAEPGTFVRVSPINDRGVGADGVPRRFRLELGAQGALVAIDAQSREVLALVGSYEAVRGGLDRATYARRQPGSTFKPVLYSYGIHTRKLTAATAIPTEAELARRADE